jgi:hypothetical protein
MNLSWLLFPFAVAASSSAGPREFPVQFAKAVTGREVTVCIDGWKVETTFAGKLGFRDATHSWQSVCADLRSPVSTGQFFTVQLLNSQAVGGNVARAGNIVANCFKSAQTPEQCAGLQIAVWKALEDGDDQPNFRSGHFQVNASPAIMIWAQQYYTTINQPGVAIYLQTAAAGGGQSGGGGGAGGQGGGGQGGAGGQGGGGQGGGGGQSQLSSQ